MDITLRLLQGHADLAPVLAEWHHAEFGHLYDPLVWNLEIARLELEAMAEPGSEDLTWVAVGGPIVDAESLLGSVSLIRSDDLPGFEDLTPWLASLYVVPRARGTGIGSMLVDVVLREAAARGHHYVHLFTAGQERYYAERGWRAIAAAEQRGHPATVMARATSERGVRRAVSSRWCSDPDDVVGAFHHLSTGPITRVLATYDSRWWPTHGRPIRVVGSDELRQAVDVTDVTGVPTLCWFATGDAARAIETMSEHEQCVLIDRVTRECGLAAWTPDAVSDHTPTAGR